MKRTTVRNGAGRAIANREAFRAGAMRGHDLFLVQITWGRMTDSEAKAVCDAITNHYGPVSDSMRFYVIYSYETPIAIVGNHLSPFVWHNPNRYSQTTAIHKGIAERALMV